MSTNFEHRARERQQASEAQREKKTKETLGPFIRGKIKRVLHKTQTFRINGTFRLK